jgi:hypothetical protein
MCHRSSRAGTARTRMGGYTLAQRTTASHCQQETVSAVCQGMAEHILPCSGSFLGGGRMLGAEMTARGSREAKGWLSPCIPWPGNQEALIQSSAHLLKRW